MTEEDTIRLFIDEDVWLGLAEALRERGFNDYSSCLDQINRPV